ncbi:MAG: SOS response-associated peptidase family protein, partial [Bdellovibrionales bacterium]|nr:SOS response-associated peptidase family protein [Bdellovibrionales bacterium]
MCSQFILKIKPQHLAIKYNILIPEGLDDIDARYLPYQTASVIAANPFKEYKLQLSPMSFSLIPYWSKESRVKFATHNARIETVLEKPTWKNPFLTKHCLIPMTGFYEAVYQGPEAGHIIKFASEVGSPLFAAGIYDLWKDPNDHSKKIFSFAILTTPPSSFISDPGHDRTPLFLDFNNSKPWLE